MPRRPLKNFSAALCFATLFSISSLKLMLGQDSSSLSGSILDPSGAAVPGASISLRDQERKTLRNASSSGGGIFTFDALPPGDYTLTIAREGFRPLRVDLIRLTARDQRNLRLSLEISAAATASVTVTEQLQGLSTDVSTGSAFDGKGVRNLPVNGRNVQALVNLAPGVVSTNNGGPEGAINANGLRANTNYYTVDGVSANTGILPVGGGGPLGGAALSGSGSSPGTSASGSGAGLISMDAMQEIRVQTSAFAPEYGRSPGAQISILSRGGGNAFHGSLFEFFRHDRFNANDWFANQAGLGRPTMRQNNFGGVLGGRIIPNRTYFFASFDRSQVRQPQTAFVSVPDNATRQTASAALRPYLNAFPVANGSSLGNNAAQFTSTYSNPGTTTNASLRLDHTIKANMNVFLRYATTPSANDVRGGGISSVNTKTRIDSRNQALTGSWVWLKDEETTNDLRINYTSVNSRSDSQMDTFGGATPLADATIFPAGVNSRNGNYNLIIQGLGSYTIGQGANNTQQQINLVDTWSKTSRAHQYKFGLDYRRLSPTYNQRPYSASFIFNGLSGESDSFLAGKASNATVSSNDPQSFPLYQNFSAYGQDTWHATDRTTLTYGVRWDVNPAPRARKGVQPFAIASDGSTLTQESPLYNTRWFNLAPRVGLAYQMDNTPNREMMFRSGFGFFYDVGYGSVANAFSSAPYSNQVLLNSANFPLASSDLAPPRLPPTRPFGQISAADPDLSAPLVYQWQANIERYFGRAQSLEVGYVGTKGRLLLRNETQPNFFGTDYDILRKSTNGAESDYHGLNVQYRRRFSNRLQAQTNYTYSHSIDTSSNDMGLAGFAAIFGDERASSNFDLRHNFNATGTYQLPGTQMRVLKPLLNGWAADFIFTARSGLPFDIQAQTETTSTTSTSTRGPRGFFAQVRPNYNGLPVYVSDPNVPGGRRVNRAAFTSPKEFSQGNLGRNIIRGFGATQLDFTLRREIALGDSVRLQLRAEGYNLFNHPNFANPLPQEGAFLSSSNFGVLSRMGNSGFGGTANVYSSGGPRNMQFALRLEF